MTQQSKLATSAISAAGLLLVLPYGIHALSGKVKPANKDVEKEFGGTVGAYATMVSLPGIIYFLYYACGRDFVMRGVDFRSLANLKLPNVSELCSWRALGISSAWLGFQVLLERFLPGKVVEGVDLGAAGGVVGAKLKYRMNGHKAFWCSIAALGALFVNERGRDCLASLYDRYAELAGASTAISLGLSAWLYASSFGTGKLLARGGDTGSPIYDFFIGRELNPRLRLPGFAGVPDLDLKEFCELRPGLIGWAALNFGMAAKQLQLTGEISGSMLLVNVMQGLYVWDALYQEQAILSTMDITTDGFGFMLAFGDLTWVPFTYGLQARYLVDHDPGLSKFGLAVTAMLGLGGYIIFRASNSQKDAFRRDPSSPSVRHLETLQVTNLQTKKPSKLLVSGWWGLARKINYTGDWLMSWSWSMTTGCPFPGGSILTYFYPIYFAVLLGHRAARDDHFCSEKYGEAWAEYKKRVPYIFFPYLL
eukprot:CAMPEP_0197632052 /NCGR_PEP_ID=MMETSP1338-20131121/8988_1 /TAXON_ID=43686 ORGANISM="Pelagodinium beii, Strain RCC1491" /NCGR_SAMPLE_ID=MMETSP1338 /ASSEMBLY_ACC=CAM_ASM_000754 /LENGTH=477 /DNA_ID=CAMNT_0043203601 /DNA_START=48 /DNA_END=1481 /DNA_ORIENTATION=+